jgi:hypothetical protein
MSTARRPLVATPGGAALLTLHGLVVAAVCLLFPALWQVALFCTVNLVAAAPLYTRPTSRRTANAVL